YNGIYEFNTTISGYCPTQTKNYNTTATPSFYLMDTNGAFSGYQPVPYFGQMACASFYGTALTGAEIIQSMNLCKALANGSKPEFYSLFNLIFKIISGSYRMDDCYNAYTSNSDADANSKVLSGYNDTNYDTNVDVNNYDIDCLDNNHNIDNNFNIN